MKTEVTSEMLEAIKFYSNRIAYRLVELNKPLDASDFPELENPPTFGAAVKFLEENDFAEVRFGFIRATSKLRERVSKTLKQEQERKSV